ncbi:hypothetical protein QE152_g21693 [Popillia japonica]|uniref:Uncharacterized protein n=1 Tax=Popillia japonica TaxID=7064 RepID=A0AAW1KNJ9_POPJA
MEGMVYYAPDGFVPAALYLGISQWRVWCTMRRMGLCPQHYTPVQDQCEQDPPQRLQFCRFLLASDIEDEQFLKRILWPDESKFDREGISNYHNIHYWSPENPHLRGTLIGPHFLPDVLMGIIGGTLIGPHFLPDVLDGPTYEAFLRDHLFEMLDEVPRLFYGITYSKCWTKFL